MTFLRTNTTTAHAATGGDRFRRPSRSGVAATEFALVLPLLLLLTFAGTDFGRALHAHIALSNACRAGAEYGSRNPYSPTDIDDWESRIRQAVDEELSNTPAIDPDKLDIDIDVEVDSDDLFRVSVEATYPFTTLVSWPGIPHEVTLHRRVEMRRQR